jgi:hypothetical protein
MRDAPLYTTLGRKGVFMVTVTGVVDTGTFTVRVDCALDRLLRTRTVYTPSPSAGGVTNVHVCVFGLAPVAKYGASYVPFSSQSNSQSMAPVAVPAPVAVIVTFSGETPTCPEGGVAVTDVTDHVGGAGGTVETHRYAFHALYPTPSRW